MKIGEKKIGRFLLTTLLDQRKDDLNPRANCAIRISLMKLSTVKLILWKLIVGRVACTNAVDDALAGCSCNKGEAMVRVAAMIFSGLQMTFSGSDDSGCRKFYCVSDGD